MKWLLLMVVMGSTVLLAGQSTLKIYVSTDDSRTDMDIIDLNTSALKRYGKAVDSTNIQFYTLTMSSQVIRIDYEELYGEDSSPVIPMAETILEQDEATEFEASIQELEEPIASTMMMEGSNLPVNAVVKTSPRTATSSIKRLSTGTSQHMQTSLKEDKNASLSVVKVQRVSPFSKNISRKSTMTSRSIKQKKMQRVRVKKTRKSKRYKGKCPRFF